MKCIACKSGHVEPGSVTFTAERDGTVVVIRGVPAEVCSNCGEEYIDSETLKDIEAIFDRAVADGVDVTVRQFKAA